MFATPTRQPDTDQPEAKTRKPYHTPHMEDFGAVNELTRSTVIPGPYDPTDGPSFYTSAV